MAGPTIQAIYRYPVKGLSPEPLARVTLSLGATRLQMLVRVLLPNLIPTALAAWLFAFIISFDEVVVTLFLAGTYYTVPKRMFNELILQINPTITAIATLLIALSVLTIALVAWLMRRAGVLGRALG